MYQHRYLSVIICNLDIMNSLLSSRPHNRTGYCLLASKSDGTAYVPHPSTLKQTQKNSNSSQKLLISFTGVGSILTRHLKLEHMHRKEIASTLYSQTEQIALAETKPFTSLNKIIIFNNKTKVQHGQNERHVTT